MPSSPDTARRALANEFACHYHVDELPVVTSEQFRDAELPQRAAESAHRLRHVVADPDRAALISLLRAAADDPAHPLNATIDHETVVDWAGDEGTRSVLQQLLRRIADDLEAPVR